MSWAIFSAAWIAAIAWPALLGLLLWRGLRRGKGPRGLGWSLIILVSVFWGLGVNAFLWEPETLVVGGTGSQPDTSNRWGDYSAMRIDQDGCTFWYTTEYYKVTASFDWSTQIASAKFANCN